MSGLENIAQKSDYQLRWIIANESSYPESQIKAALEELKKREMVMTSVKYNKNHFKRLQNFFRILFE